MKPSASGSAHRGRVLLIVFAALAACRRAPTDPAREHGARLATVPPEGASAADEAIRRAEARVAAEPANAERWIELGEGWIRKARGSGDPAFYANANAAAARALAIDPASLRARDLQALVALNDHRFAQAAALAGDVLARRPDDLLALGALSDALLEQGRFDEAKAAVARMMDLKPGYAAYARASWLRWLTGDADGAIELMRLAIDAADLRDPEPRAWAIAQAALYFWHRGDLRGADAGFDLALRTLDGYPPALVGKARVAIATGDPARAVKLLERAWAASPLPETEWLLADARTLAGDAKGAAEAEARVVRQGARGDPRTLSLFDSVRDRDRGEALRLAREERRTRGDVHTHDVLAWALYRAGQPGEARAESDEALRLGTREARLLFHAGAIAAAAGDAARGGDLLRQALALNPAFDPTEAAEARRLLAGLEGAVAQRRSGDVPVGNAP
jgi:tetratricopeptide (TPR) repeat protein